MPSQADQAVASYLDDVAEIRASDHTTDELSYYPPLRNLLQAFGELTTPQRTTAASPRAIEEDFPDLALYERKSQVLVIAVEAKPAEWCEEELLDLEQGRRYARTFGGGQVLLTNLWEIIWAELDESSDTLIRRDSVSLVSDPEDLEEASPTPRPDAATELLALLDAACSVRSTIEDAERVATLLAYHASRMVERVDETGDPQELLRPLAESMRDGLGMDLDDEFFTSTVVQTVVYGLFAAWLNSPAPKEFDHRRASELLELRVIADLFHQILHPNFIRRCDLTPSLEGAARVLKWVDRETFVDQFDDYAIEYFYEPFLRQFDPDLRDRLGVWYTPREIATYQVRRVHNHLQQDLEIEDGLADDEVILLDPAVGTGTYLAEVLNFLYEYHTSRGEPDSIAAGRVLEAAYRRIIGFDVLPAALVICHLHLHRFLQQLGVSFAEDRRLRIYLTNSLLGWGQERESLPPMPLTGLETELRESLEVKREEPVLAIVGNPPYDGYSTAETDEEKALVQNWIDGLWEQFGIRKHRVGNLYVRFWRAAVRKIVDLTGRGVISFITDRKWLGGRSFPLMRRQIVREFHEIVVDDLHGSYHETGHPDDGSVFTTETASGIRQGVAITTAVRTGESNGQTNVRRRDFRGSGAAKRAELLELTENDGRLDEDLEDHDASEDNRWKLVPDPAGDFPRLDEYFHFYVSAVQPVREDATMAAEPSVVRERMIDYFDDSLSNEEFFEEYPAFAMERERYQPGETRSALLGDSRFIDERVVPYLFRPLDGRWLYWEVDHKLLNEARRQLMPYYLRRDEGDYEQVGGQCVLVASQTPRRPSGPKPAVTTGVPAFECVDPNARVLPRIRPPREGDESADLDQTSLEDLGWTEDEEQGFLSNVRPEWLAAVRDAGVDGTRTELGDVVFFGTLAVMYAPAWVDSIGTDNDDFPGVPLPADGSSLERARDIGRRIANLLDPFSEVDGVTTGEIESRFAGIAIPDQSDDRVVTAGHRHRGGTYVSDGAGAVLWNDEGGWRDIPEEIWEYRIGGFPVLPKWLGYRHESRGEDGLSDRELETFTHLCRRIAALIELEPECDDIYETSVENALEPNEPAVSR